MVSLITPLKAQRKLAENVRAQRLEMDLTQEGLSERSGVALPTLRKFEQKGVISLESFLKIFMVIGDLEPLISATKATPPTFSSIDEVLSPGKKTGRKRGRLK